MSGILVVGSFPSASRIARVHHTTASSKSPNRLLRSPNHCAICEASTPEGGKAFHMRSSSDLASSKESLCPKDSKRVAWRVISIRKVSSDIFEPFARFVIVMLIAILRKSWADWMVESTTLELFGPPMTLSPEPVPQF